MLEKMCRKIARITVRKSKMIILMKIQVTFYTNLTRILMIRGRKLSMSRSWPLLKLSMSLRI